MLGTLFIDKTFASVSALQTHLENADNWSNILVKNKQYENIFYVEKKEKPIIPLKPEFWKVQREKENIQEFKEST